MKRMKKPTMLIGIIALVMVAESAGAVPLGLVNGGFETGTGATTTSAQYVGSNSSLASWNQWANFDSVSTSQSNLYVAEGTNSAFIDAGGQDSGLYQYGSWDAGTYTFSGWVYVETGIAGIGLAANGAAVGFDYSTIQNGWEYLTITATFSSPWVGGALVYSGNSGIANSFYVDALRVDQEDISTSAYAPIETNAVPEPGTILLLGSGILGLGLIGRLRKKHQA